MEQKKYAKAKCQILGASTLGYYDLFKEREHREAQGQTRQAIVEYIEVFYNRQRAQKHLGYPSPGQYLNQCNSIYKIATNKLSGKLLIILSH
jgi:aspartate/glutamate racemase